MNWTKDEAGRWKMDEVPDSEQVYIFITKYYKYLSIYK